MAGLSINRRRQAWFKGVSYGASGFGRCRFEVPKLKEIFERGMLHGKLHVDTPYVKAIVEQEQRRRRPAAATPRSARRASGREGTRFGRGGGNGPRRSHASGF